MSDYPSVYPDLSTGPPQFLASEEEVDLLDDIEALGEKLWWCEEHLCSGEGRALGCWKSDLLTENKIDCRMVEQLRIPIPKPVRT